VKNNNERQVSTVAAVRRLMPNRPLTLIEAFSVAERQATKFLALSGIETAPVPDVIISQLPRVKVKRVSPLPSSGLSQWSAGSWQIMVNGSEPPLRQRFTLAHEFKHVLDHPFIDRCYPDVVGARSHERAEQICDYFAGCLLMPKAWVTKAYCDAGIQELRLLARRFAISQMAMRVRLLQLGLIEPQPRCTPYRRASLDLIPIQWSPEGMAA
jgi:hypothetical protein